MPDAPRREAHIFTRTITRRTLLASAACSASGQSAPPQLWDPSAPLPDAAGLPELPGLRFSVIKPFEPERDGGYGFLHGVALVWHKGKLYASFAHNKNPENTTGEEARWRVSEDAGKSWSPVFDMDKGTPEVAVSHGSFLSRRGKLWAFLGAFSGVRSKVHTRAYLLDEKSNVWQPRGVIVRDGFWPMQEPLPMRNGNWIMAGFDVGNGEPAAVAISHGDDFTRWDHIVIPRDPALKTMWGESTVIVQGNEVWNIARYGGEALALLSRSTDGGRTWTPMRPANLPMATAKPYAGTLSTRQRYLICTTTAGTKGQRAPLTIAVTRPGHSLFSKVFRIRNAEHTASESHPGARLAYPYAVEYKGHLYVGYSNSGGRRGNNNSAELAVIPLAALRIS